MKYILLSIFCFFATQFIFSHGGVLIVGGLSLLLSFIPLKYRANSVAIISSFLQLGLTIFIGYTIFRIAYGYYEKSIIPLLLSTIHLFYPLIRDLSQAKTALSNANENCTKYPDVEFFKENEVANKAIIMKVHWTFGIIALTYFNYFLIK